MKSLFQNAQWFDLLDPELERLLIEARERLRHEKRRRGIEQSWLDWVWETLGY